MNFPGVSRAMARLGYVAVRLSLSVLDEYVVALYWDKQAPVRRGFERFLGSVDKAAGWLLAEDDIPAKPATQASTAEVVFTLPAEVQASSVALCGEFNQWSAEDIWLERGGDGCWRATVALEPGHSYRYRYLLDGERWENAWHADYYVPNPYGSTDSVVVVG